MGPRHLAQCYRCRRTFEAEHRGARYCPECEREQRRRFRVLPGGRDPRYGRLVIEPRPASRGTAGRRSTRGPVWLRAGGRRGAWPWGGRWGRDWRWRRWHQPLRLLAVVAAASAARVVWDQMAAGPAPVEWLVYLVGAAWIWNRRDEAA
ncbi:MULTISPECIES: hypothetical protein [Thermaerobacter]|uniref:Uncharacterized protein n=1 Tax=Thermaerobacter composti TaxID=554949 RepID=A0ABZ0QKN1_9FIRM|nr:MULTISPECIES: hypothetical protein [Thermaerobacter]QBS38046.1 hypothetical protein E1B22_10065 [Thermaerobacter sp. FW80]WPD18059.1 hypothetical protein Q5761_06590 [Thermaerobacter composti]